MRHTAVDIESGKAIRTDQLPDPLPDYIKWQFMPRIRCNDCPMKLYTPGPEHTVENFEVHLKNKQHKERVDEHRRNGQWAAERVL
jgi:SWI/SNF-related matrix-associated actin-dependent regulator of chromatin subfamily B protein 1